jgi:N utilization substance protein A
MTSRGPEIRLSRTSPMLVTALFAQEIPEILNGTVEIKNIAREAGSRAKVAVSSNDEAVDPIGSCIGQRGTRIQTIIRELGGEKVDVVLWDEDASTYIKASLSPAKVTDVELNENDHLATVRVKPDQLSLAIGKGGQNVRLAAKLTGWKITIVEEGGSVAATSDEAPESAADSDETAEATPVMEGYEEQVPVVASQESKPEES